MPHALDNRDPFGGAQVLSRGIAGTREDAAGVASPIFRQPFDLRTGRCLTDAHVAMPTYRVPCVDGVVEVHLPGRVA